MLVGLKGGRSATPICGCCCVAGREPEETITWEELDPLTFGVDVGKGVDGPDNVRATKVGNAFGAIDDVAQCEAKIAVASRKEIEGVGVAVDGAALDAKKLPHRARARPEWRNSSSMSARSGWRQMEQ